MRRPAHPSSVQVAQSTVSSKTHALHAVGVAKLDRGGMRIDDGVSADVDEGASAKEGATGAERVALHVQSLDGVHVQAEQHTPCWMVVDCQRVALYLVENGRMELGNDRELFRPSKADDVADCDVYEYPARVRLTSRRWYDTVVRIQDGSAIIIGGFRRGGWMNNVTTNTRCVLR